MPVAVFTRASIKEPCYQHVCSCVYTQLCSYLVNMPVAVFILTISYLAINTSVAVFTVDNIQAPRYQRACSCVYTRKYSGTSLSTRL
jgi:hypothetical protein